MRFFSGGYHILVIPENTAKTKRLHVSVLTLRLFALCMLLIVPLVMGSVLMALHYQNKLFALKQGSAEERQILEQKEILAARMSNLERSLAHSDETLTHLQKVLDVDLGEMKNGVGPIETHSIFDAQRKTLPEAVVSMDGDDFDNYLEKGGDVNVSALRGMLNNMETKMSGFHAKVEEIYKFNEDKLRFLNATPNTLPVDGWITSEFGERVSPTSGGYRMHYGLDIAAPTGTAVRAPADGRVLVAESKGGYGQEVLIDHGYGVMTLYGHASKLFVKEGQEVKKGQQIALVGSTGSSTGPHCHYEVHVDGIPTDPMQYVLK